MSAIVVGCSAGSGEGLDISGRPIGDGGEVPLAPTLASIQANVFNPSCIVCHSGASAPQGLRLDAGNSFANLVGIPSSEVPSIFRVTPGDPDQSYLIQKLQGTASVGDQMPLVGPPIPQATIDFVRQWIIDGALPDPTQTPPGALPVVVALTPDPDGIVTTLPQQILASFSQDIDASTINSMTFQLVRSGGDGGFMDGNEQAILPSSVSLSGTNPRLAVMNLSGVVSVEDRYQVILRGSGASIVLDLNGQALDGEFSTSLPSGDGLEGGDFVVEFLVQGLQATLQSIQDNVFTPICAGCHSGPAGPNLPSGQDLSSAQASFDNLVGVASLQVPSIFRVAAGDADNSYLIQKLEGTASAGDRMPQGGPFLDQADIDVIRTWIVAGAAPPSGNSPPAAVAAASPKTGVAPVNVAFDSTGSSDTDGTIVVFSWDFGDGARSAQANPSHTYNNVGVFTAVLTVTDDDGATASSSVTITVSSSAPPPLEPTLQSIQDNVFSRRCAGCHSGPTEQNLPSGMNLSSAQASFNNLVGVSSLQMPSILRVAAGDADNSYLIHKLEGTAKDGKRMPRDGPPYLDQTEIDVIRSWINAGANP